MSCGLFADCDRAEQGLHGDDEEGVSGRDPKCLAEPIGDLARIADLDATVLGRGVARELRKDIVGSAFVLPTPEPWGAGSRGPGIRRCSGSPDDFRLPQSGDREPCVFADAVPRRRDLDDVDMTVGDIGLHLQPGPQVLRYANGGHQRWIRNRSVS